MINDNWNQQARNALERGRALAEKYGSPLLGTEHLLVGISAQRESVASRLLQKEGMDESLLIALLEKERGTAGSVPTQLKGLTQRCKQALEWALNAGSGQEEGVSAELLLMGIVRQTHSTAVKMLKATELDINQLYNELGKEVQKQGEGNAVTAPVGKTGGNSTPNLDSYGRDLTQQAKNAQLDPVIGRELEISRVIQILSRRTKNNPVLIGEPGVGKTAIAEALAQRIAMGEVPENLCNKRVVSLDLTGMVAGTKYRGEFEERIKAVLDEVKADENIILFIDELHTLIGAGAAEGAMDAANIIKPALGRGGIRLIGATTINEYRKYIEKDAALERRFQSVLVEEPSEEDCIAIIKGLRESYEKHHGLTISDEAVESAVKLSKRYIADRFLPDKAIDIMDEAASRVRLENYTPPQGLKAIEKRLQALREEKDEAIKAQDFEQAALLRDREKEQQAQLEQERNSWNSTLHGQHSTVTPEDIAQVVSSWTGVPVQSLTQDEAQRLLHMEEVLHKRLVGQEDGVNAVSKAIRRGRVGLKDPKRPVGSFLFLGPTGVGKTELCKALAEAVFGDENAMIRLDMSEYMEKHTVSKLIGSPPGYVGYDEGGQLTEKVRRKPYSVVLFDEVEKADDDVFNILLQIMDDGRLTDAQGRLVDFRNTIVVMTSNLGAQRLTEKKKTLGFSATGEEERSYEETKNLIMQDLKRRFRPEFLNRIDDTIVFRSLTPADIRTIAGHMLESVQKRLAELGVELMVEDEALDALCEEGYDAEYGARPLRRTIQSRVEDTAAERMLEGVITKGAKARLTLREGKIDVCPVE